MSKTKGGMGHDPVGQPRIRSKVGNQFQCVDDDPRVVVPHATLGALVDVIAKGGDAETGFAVNHKVDLVGE